MAQYKVKRLWRSKGIDGSLEKLLNYSRAIKNADLSRKITEEFAKCFSPIFEEEIKEIDQNRLYVLQSTGGYFVEFETLKELQELKQKEKE